MSTTETKERAKPIWITLRLDPLEETLVIIGLDEKLPDAALQLSREQNSAEDAKLVNSVCYVKVFKLFDINGRELLEWFMECGVARTDAMQLVRNFGASLVELLLEPNP